MCPVGFGGMDCSITAIDPCQFNTCDIAGTQSCLTTNNGTSYSCQCKPSYTGTNCNQLIPPCLSNPCLNNSTCSSSKFLLIIIFAFIKIIPYNYSEVANQYTCNCLPGYGGVNCETILDYCVSNKPCGAFGNCSAIANSTNYTCNCYIGFTGKK